MTLYADFAPRRIRQIVADFAALVVIALAILAGVVVHGAISALGATFGRLQDAGTGFEGTMGELGDSLGGIPLFGDGVRDLFESAAGAGGSIAAVGRDGQAIVEAIAIGAGIGVAALPIAIVLIVWLVPRVRFVLRARMTRALLQLEDGPALLALRALDDATAKELSAISAHPVQAWLRQDADVVHRLAALEAREAGVRIPERRAGAAAQTA